MTQQNHSNDIGLTSSSNLNKVKLEYTINGQGQSIKKDYELLVVACDPRNLSQICDYTSEERAIFDKLINFTFHTSLLKVKLKTPSEDTKTYPVIFAPSILNKTDGSVYAFRNESVKQFGSKQANGMTHNLVTVYRFAGETGAWTPDKFEQILRQQLQNSDWSVY